MQRHIRAACVAAALMRSAAFAQDDFGGEQPAWYQPDSNAIGPDQPAGSRPVPQTDLPDEYTWIFGDSAAKMREESAAEAAHPAEDAETGKTAPKPDAREAARQVKPQETPPPPVPAAVLDDTPESSATRFVWNAGQVREGAIVEHTFVWVNDSSRTVNIGNVHTSCGCTVSEVAKKTVAPGESATIKVKVNTKGYAGPIRQFVYMSTDSPESPLVAFVMKITVAQGR